MNRYALHEKRNPSIPDISIGQSWKRNDVTNEDRRISYVSNIVIIGLNHAKNTWIVQNEHRPDHAAFEMRESEIWKFYKLVPDHE